MVDKRLNNAKIGIMEINNSILYIFSGLPGTGKSTLANIISKKLNAAYLRIDTIEQGIRELCSFNVQGEGYRLAYKIIEDNLKIGNNVITDQCNPWKLTREEFNNVAIKNNCEYKNIEVICSNIKEHKKRIEKRGYPAWEDVNKWKYEPWNEEHIVIDTANRTIDECINELMNKINNNEK